MRIESTHYEGSHLVIDAFGSKKSSLSNESLILKILSELPKILGMIPISKPIVVNYKPKSPIKVDEHGVTGSVIIAESHISIHTYPSKGYFAMDIFSCKEFNVEKTLTYITKRLKPTRIEQKLIRRGHSESFSEKDIPTIHGIDITKSRTTKDLIKQFKNTGFQATNLAKSVEIIQKMKKDNATIFLTFTSNMVSSGLREVFSYLCKNKFVDLIITGVGSIEEDLIKTKKTFLLGDFHMDDIELHKKGINRIGNILVPNDRYELLEDLLIPFFTKMYQAQKRTNKLISPSKLIHELGKTVNDKSSILYWATKNKIPIFCPAITDGALGLQVFFFKQKYPEFGIDTTSDMKKLADITLFSKKTGGILLGGGFAKHHAIGVNILREGMDYAVYVSTATQYDGSMSGARNTEAISWSKIKEEANSIFVEGDATILFPLMISSIENEF